MLGKSQDVFGFEIPVAYPSTIVRDTIWPSGMNRFKCIRESRELFAESGSGFFLMRWI